MTPMRIEVEWLPVTGVTAPELAATWCRLELWVADRCLTEVQDRRSLSIRRWLVVPAYPLAEWLAAHWWLLQVHERPLRFPQASWTWRSSAQRPVTPWLRQHNLRGAADGFAWPDLTLVPEGRFVRAVWNADESPGPNASTRFLSAGSTEIERFACFQALHDFIDIVTRRLDDARISGTFLHDEWLAARGAEASQEERDFCEALARLGIDPLAASDEMAELVITIGNELERPAFEELLSAADPAQLRRVADWCKQAEKLAEGAPDAATLSAASEALLGDVFGESRQGGPNPAPWMSGYTAARLLRSKLGIDEADPFDFAKLDIDPDAWVETVLDAEERSLDALVARHDGRTRVVPAHVVKPIGRTFTVARALALAAEASSGSSLLTKARTSRQRLGRAFAAELLAPAAGIRLQLPSQLPTVDDIEACAEYYGVRPLTIEHQIHNHQLALLSGYDRPTA